MKIKYKNRLSFFLVAVLVLWIKIYLAYKLSFNLDIENIKQEIILLINPVSSILFLLGLSLFVKKQHMFVILTSFVCTIVLYANVLYYRFYNDFITIPVLFQSDNMGDLGSSIWELVTFYDFLFFLDLIILLYLGKRSSSNNIKRKQKFLVFGAAAAVFLLNIMLAETERPQLLTRTFDRELLIKNIGTFNYHVYDVLLQTKSKAQRALADGSEIVEIENYVKAKYKEPNPSFWGRAKGKNLIVISLESTQNFVINNTVNGKEITPFLNDLVKESYYFNNFYHQTGQGKTSDAEFLVENSLYPLPSGAVFFTHSQNQYNATPEILKKNGYYSAVLHANNKSFWNRDVMYQTLGYDRFYSEDDFEITEKNSVGWGLKDEYFFEQSVNYLKNLHQPYYAKLLTLTNHFPFELAEEDKLIPEYTSSSRTLNRYFTTVRYEDEALKKFFERLKKEGLYENSIIVIYGDHYGISENHNKAMGQYLGKKITPFESVQLQRVPFIVHIPGEKGKEMNTVSGEIDVKPTLLHLLGINTKNDIQMGEDLFAKDRRQFAVLRDGSFITDKYVYTENKCYQKSDGSILENQYCDDYSDTAKQELNLSDEIIYGDLLRFFGK